MRWFNPAKAQPQTLQAKTKPIRVPPFYQAITRRRLALEKHTAALSHRGTAVPICRR